MPLIYADPSFASPDDPVMVALQGGFISGVSSSGVMAEVRSYGSQDYELTSPSLIRTVVTDEVGRKTFTTGASALGTGRFTLASKYPASASLGSFGVEYSRLGYLVRLLDDLLCAFKCIPRFDEPGRMSENGMFGRWGWGNWHIDPEPVLLRNSTEWLDLDYNSGNAYYIDYEKGIIYFQTPIPGGADIRASYNMRLVPQKAFRSFFTIALSMINGRKPQTGFDENSFPDTWIGLMVLAAYELACKCLLAKIQMFQYRRLFEEPDRLTSELRVNASEAKASFELLLPQIKRRGYVLPLGLTEYNYKQPYMVDETNFRQFAITR